MIRTKLSDDLILVRQRIEAWTQEQVQVLDGLARNRRAMIYGGAGTGKTILAMEKSRRLAKEGKRSLIVTFNVPLAVWIANEMRGIPQAQVFHFHGLVRHVADRARRQQTHPTNAIRFQMPKRPESAWYHGPDSDLLIDSAGEIDFQVDAIVVDEGQDFAEHQWDALGLLLKDAEEGEFHVFLDRHQSLYTKEWKPPFDGMSYDLTKNCRNTKQVAEVLGRVMGDVGEPAMVKGPEVVFTPIENFEGAAKALRQQLDEVINKESIPAEEVAILTTDRSLVDALVGTSIAGSTLVRPPSTDGVRVETINRFKGLEADAIFLILPDEPRGNGSDLDEYQRKLAYVGISRPRFYLSVLAHRSVGTALGLA